MSVVVRAKPGAGPERITRQVTRERPEGWEVVPAALLAALPAACGAVCRDRV
jgi:hypothetical protein